MGTTGWVGDIADGFSLFYLPSSTATFIPINAMTQLNACNLSFSVEGSSILENVSLSVSSGEWLGIAGLNGSGKSTLLKCMAGLLIPSSGQMSIDGQPYS